MNHKISRRSVLATGVAGIAASAVVGLGIAPALASTANASSAHIGCSHSHQKLGFQLGALMVDPSLSDPEKDILLATTVCPDCHAQIEPQGLSYSEHMPADGSVF